MEMCMGVHSRLVRLLKLHIQRFQCRRESIGHTLIHYFHIGAS